jgi:DNA-binding NarL/FixJ family response regulator
MIEGSLPSRDITAERAANRALLIVSEVRLLREGIAESIEGNSGLSVVGTCEKLIQIFGALHEYPGAMVLLDAAFPNGLEALKAIRAADSLARVVVFALSETEENIVAWARAGSAGYIPRTAALRESVQFIRSIDRGEQICSAAVASRLMRRIGSLTDFDKSDSRLAASLTGREHQIVGMIAEGLSNKEIARRLKIELSTTKSHVHNLLQKLGLERRGQIAHWAHVHVDQLHGRVGPAA